MADILSLPRFDNERTLAFWTIELRAYERKILEADTTGSAVLRVGTIQLKVSTFCLLPTI